MNKAGKLKNKINGFTLIELLVVIAIIALLMAIMMPGLQKAKDSAKKVICTSNLSQWGKIWSSYLSENNDKFSRGWYGDINDRDGQWMYVIRDYMGEDRGIWTCPFADNPEKCRYSGNGTELFGYEEVTPQTPWGRLRSLEHVGYETEAQDYGSYGFNAFLYDPPDLDLSTPGTKKDYWRSSILAKASPSQVPLFMDSMWCEVWALSTENPRNNENGLMGVGINNVFINRHRDGIAINMLNLDMSSEKIKIKDLWSKKWSTSWEYRSFEDYQWPDWVK